MKLGGILPQKTEETPAESIGNVCTFIGYYLCLSTLVPRKWERCHHLLMPPFCVTLPRVEVAEVGSRRVMEIVVSSHLPNVGT